MLITILLADISIPEFNMMSHKTCPEAILFEPEYSCLCAKYESL